MNFYLIIILLIIIVSILNIVCFFIGAVVGQKVVNGERLQIPEMNPIIRHAEKKKQKKLTEEHDKQEENFLKNLRNIDNYNGTSFGQEDFE